MVQHINSLKVQAKYFFLTTTKILLSNFYFHFPKLLLQCSIRGASGSWYLFIHSIGFSLVWSTEQYFLCSLESSHLQMRLCVQCQLQSSKENTPKGHIHCPKVHCIPCFISGLSLLFLSTKKTKWLKPTSEAYPTLDATIQQLPIGTEIESRCYRPKVSNFLGWDFQWQI